MARSKEPDNGTKAQRRILIVEDDREVGTLVGRAFEPDYEILRAADGLSGLALAREHQPGVVVTDQFMPGLSGVELLSRVKEELPRTVRILTTGYTDYGSLVEAVNTAAVHYYFEKPISVHALRPVVDTFLRNAELEREREALLGDLARSVAELELTNQRLREHETALTATVAARTEELAVANQELQATNRHLQELALRDGLTQLFNHETLLEHINLEAARAKRYGRRFCLLFIDLDDFKQVNDTCGHAIGDAVLCGLADLFRSQLDGLRRSDFAARYGGEEFCIVLPETPLEGGQVKAERIRRAVESANWRAVARDIDRPVTISVGVAAFPDHGDSAPELLEAADVALYEAKRQGKNRVALGRPALVPAYARTRAGHA